MKGLKKFLPQSLYTRSLVIVIAPMVILQALLSYIFMERHWVAVSQKLAETAASDIAFLVSLYEFLPPDEREARLVETARTELNMLLSFAPPDSPPPFAEEEASFAPFDFPQRHLRATLAQRIDYPSRLWLEPTGERAHIRVELGEVLMEVNVGRSRLEATNSHIFVVWMVGISLVLVTVAILFLRNQLRPIKRLAVAAERFGMGRDSPGFRPAGAREVRQAARAFAVMRGRIRAQMEQRTMLMAGISHDLRTLLTRFRLQLAMLEGPAGGDSKDADIAAMTRDVAEMEHILEMYLLFARDHSQEASVPVSLGELLEEIRRESGVADKIRLEVADAPRLSLRRNSIKRCLGNLVENADKRAAHILITVRRASTRRVQIGRAVADHAEGGAEIAVEDDGPGIPAAERERVFAPFRRLEGEANREIPGSGLGLAIARDIARGHGGEAWIEDSAALGGARVMVRLPGGTPDAPAPPSSPPSETPTPS